MSAKGHIVVISGFSGAGKGTLVKKLMEECDSYALSVSKTTREPRPGEIDGIHYHFVTDESFEKQIEENGFIEYAGYCGHYYGTPRPFVEEKLAQGKDVILEIEIQGAMKVKEQYPDALLLFVIAPSAQELKNRLTSRGTETADVIEKRMKRAYEESDGLDRYDYIVINDNLDDCIRQVNTIVEAAKYKPSHNVELIERIKQELGELIDH